MPARIRFLPTLPTLPILLAGLFGAQALVALVTAAPLGAQEATEQGRQVYEMWCASCHGFEGAGDGPAAAYMLPRPRNFTRGLYQIRTTAGGDIPTDADILHIIDVGMPGTTMPGWRDQLARGDREALVAYVKSFYAPFATMPEPTPLELGGAPRASDERIAEGRAFYESIECWLCHGQAGRGDGTSAPTLEDDWGFPIRAADLTTKWNFNGGGSVEDIYRTLRTGLDGTPMAAFSDLLEAGFMTDDQFWSLAQYVHGLSPEEGPRVREVIRARRVDPGGLPESLDDERWNAAESFYVPLVAQIIIKPRWFDPSVDAVWVEVLHDDAEVVFRLSWHDRSRSPDPQWADFQAAVIEAMEPVDDHPMEAGPRPDQFTVQFPVVMPTGMDRPYFLMGDARTPVYLWRWRSDGNGATEATAQGMTQIQPLTGSVGVASEARWEDGRWQLLLRRPLRTEDPANELQFETGTSIPVAFFAWDGDNGEEDTRGSVSSWFFVHLEVETPVSTYVTPLMALLLTGGLGLFVVARAQRREAATLADPPRPPEPHHPEDSTLTGPTDPPGSAPPTGESDP